MQSTHSKARFWEESISMTKNYDQVGAKMETMKLISMWQIFMSFFLFIGSMHREAWNHSGVQFVVATVPKKELLDLIVCRGEKSNE